ncbi:ABC transporter ATP-binding protein [Actinomyces bowdenii]|uniref:ABC transporter ATP-binding protein n=1 Tax=Actinomyces bowdenii TaxID=131109 RepID=UPI001ABCCF66|nr:ABC transporter ATP-binding protein [Actinomyces bowdenii]MBO3725373.1 ABC transporter ATP-binding protein [Actinomyces bowdenii]
MTTTTPRGPQRVIVAHGLTRIYGSGSRAFTAVDGIDLEVPRGQVFGLLGTNGAGKTSTLEILEGLAAPSGGSVRVLGLDPRRDRARIRPRTGTMLQSGGLPRQLTASEALAMWAGTCATPLPVAQVLDDVGLASRARVKVGALSGGEQRRLDLACALIGRPELLFLDEPTTSMDPESRRDVWDLLAGLTSRGLTMVLTTHYLEEAERLSDRIAIMHQGRIALEGTLSELVATSSSQIVFTLPDGAPPLPSLPGTTLATTPAGAGGGRAGGAGGGSAVTVTTSALQRDTLALLGWADRHGLVLQGFAARPATLETVFLGVTGRTGPVVDQD